MEAPNNGVTIRLIASTMEELQDAVTDIHRALGDRVIWLGKPRKGNRGDALAYGALLPAKKAQKGPGGGE